MSEACLGVQGIQSLTDLDKQELEQLRVSDFTILLHKVEQVSMFTLF